MDKEELDKIIFQSHGQGLRALNYLQSKLEEHEKWSMEDHKTIDRLQDTLKDYIDACCQKQEALDATHNLFKEYYDKCKALQEENERLEQALWIVASDPTKLDEVLSSCMENSDDI